MAFEVTHTAPRKENFVMVDITKQDVRGPTLFMEIVESLPLVLTPKDIAKVLQISRNTTYELMHRKDFPTLKIGKQYRVNREQFLNWLNNGVA